MVLSLLYISEDLAHTQAAGMGAVLLNDTFNNDLNGWQYFGSPGYALTLDSTTGQPAPSANISGDAWTGVCSPFGMNKTVNISQYVSGPLTLAFNWRAASSYTGSVTTNAFVDVYDAATGKQLFTQQLVGGGTYDSGWQYYTKDISQYIKAPKFITIKLYLYDCWSTNWNENNWYDNVQLFEGTLPPGSPTGLVATALSSSQTYLSWTAPANTGGSPITGYEIERSADNGTTWTTIVANSNNTATTYTDSGLSQKTTYGYRVSTIDAGGTSSPSNTAFVTTLPSNVFIDDNFNNGLNGWQYFGSPGYALTLDSTTGQPAPSANISGDAWTGVCSPFGMNKTVNISQYVSGPLTLAFNWRAASSYTGSVTTNAFVDVYDAATGKQLFTQQLVGGGTYDSGWQYYTKDISQYIKAPKFITIKLYLYDCWSTNWNENNWYDNVQLFAAKVHPPAVAIEHAVTNSPPPFNGTNSGNSTAP